jgi:pimeloyl-ACP methyl ester carboxylesterase
MSETYRWRGGTEMLLRHGAGSPVTLLVLPALFEEANRMRRFSVCVMRLLAAQQIGTILPDLPGAGESQTKLSDVTLGDWCDAVSALSSNVWGSIAIRGGALLDKPLRNRWQLSPESGERLLRDMVRATALSAGVSPSNLAAQARKEPTRLAGNLLNPALYTALSEAMTLDGAHVSPDEGPKLWRAAEPSDDPEFARRVAADIAAWVKTCAA